MKKKRHVMGAEGYYKEPRKLHKPEPTEKMTGANKERLAWIEESEGRRPPNTTGVSEYTRRGQ